jgi:hypothetical protein
VDVCELTVINTKPRRASIYLNLAILTDSSDVRT